MVQCFVPDCNHRSVVNTCRFHRFPKSDAVRNRWIRYIKRADRAPSPYSRVCSCHFKDGLERGPTWFLGRSHNEPVEDSPSQPLEPSTSQPSTSQPLEPSTSQPSTSQPLEPSTSQPSTSQPLEPSTSQPLEPSTSQPLEPSTSQPLEPSTSQPLEPSTSQPSTSQPLEPSTSQPLEPSTSQPLEPSTSQPLEPSTSQPLEPSTSQPLEPSTSQPSTSQPLEPSTSQPLEPSTSQPLEPSTSQPLEPSTSQPLEPSMSQPSTSQPLEPSTSQPTQESLPMTSSPIQHVHQCSRYSASFLDEKVLRMETGFPDRTIFNIFVGYVLRFKESIVYYAGWKVECLSIDDQILMTLMKLRHNYTNLHLGQLFQCGSSCVANVVLTFIYVLHELWFKDIMAAVPSREKNQSSLPLSFQMFRNCRMVIDCTDVEIATPASMDLQKHTYSSYRGMHSFKILLGVAPNAVITYCSRLYPGSVSDKAIVAKSGILDVFKSGDVVLADKGFLIRDLLPEGVSLNIPPFLHHGKLTKSEVKLTKDIARTRIHVERANARLKEYKILHFIPHSLRSHADVVVQLCCALVNLQNPLIKEVAVNLDE
ncbi:unnamed protein product [Leuciscus chuanchicus]